MAFILISCGGDDRATAPAAPDVAPAVSADLKFKGHERLLNDIAQALELPPDQVCNELGKYSCTEDVHSVILGGVKPYSHGIYTPLPRPTVTTPIATQRVAMSGCVERVDRDQAGDQAVIFGDLPVDEAGKLVDIEGAAVTSALQVLYKRALQRLARPHELEHLRRLYREIEATGDPQPARSWAILSCTMVLTTVEQLFY